MAHGAHAGDGVHRAERDRGALGGSRRDEQGDFRRRKRQAASKHADDDFRRRQGRGRGQGGVGGDRRVPQGAGKVHQTRR